MAATSAPVRFRDRCSGEMQTETVLGDGPIRWAYTARSGQAAHPLLFGNRLLSRALGAWMDGRRSRSSIPATIRDLGIDASEFALTPERFRSFNEFFTRRLKPSARPWSQDPGALLCPADGRVLVYPDLAAGDALRVKGVDGPLDALFGRPAPRFHAGSAVVVRLCPADYHRYHFPCDGAVRGRWRLPGAYHSVNPLALAAVPQVFCRNKRAITLLDSPAFGRIAYIEVGAFGVAAIHDTYTGTQVARMQEKGFFAFGGSTVVLVFEPAAVRFDQDLVTDSAAGVETLVRVGETIGRAGGD